jgi:ribose/xylose/arabinose/galactoside ABC-type transport system permease subunit
VFIVLVTCLYFVGYICIGKDYVDRLYEDKNNGIEDIASHIAFVTIIGVEMCVVLFLFCAMSLWFIYFMIQFGLQVYNTIIELLASLRAYNSSTNNKDGDL